MTGGKANMPFVAAIVCNCCANCKISAGSAVEEMTKFTGKLSPPGMGDGVTMNSRMPGILFTIACTSGRTWNAVRFRSPHGFSTMPLKPLLGMVSWNDASISGMDLNISPPASV